MGSKQERHSLERARNPHSNTHNLYVHVCVHHIEWNDDNKQSLSLHRNQSEREAFFFFFFFTITDTEMCPKDKYIL